MDRLRFEYIDDQTAAMLRGKTGAERLAISIGLWRTATKIVTASERRRHPELDDGAIANRVAVRMSRGG